MYFIRVSLSSATTLTHFNLIWLGLLTYMSFGFLNFGTWIYNLMLSHLNYEPFKSIQKWIKIKFNDWFKKKNRVVKRLKWGESEREAILCDETAFTSYSHAVIEGQVHCWQLHGLWPLIIWLFKILIDE